MTSVLYDVPGPKAILRNRLLGAATDVVIKLNYAGTATDGADYTRVTTVTIPAGQTSARFDIATLPDRLDRSRPNVVAEVIEAALREGGIKADCSDLFSHIKIDLPTAQLAAASAVLVDLQLI